MSTEAASIAPNDEKGSQPSSPDGECAVRIHNTLSMNPLSAAHTPKTRKTGTNGDKADTTVEVKIKPAESSSSSQHRPRKRKSGIHLDRLKAAVYMVNAKDLSRQPRPQSLWWGVQWWKLFKLLFILIIPALQMLKDFTVGPLIGFKDRNHVHVYSRKGWLGFLLGWLLIIGVLWYAFGVIFKFTGFVVSDMTFNNPTQLWL
eukprot:g53077.t1